MRATQGADFKPLCLLLPLTPHWPKQVTWPWPRPTPRNKEVHAGQSRSMRQVWRRVMRQGDCSFFTRVFSFAAPPSADSHCALFLSQCMGFHLPFPLPRILFRALAHSSFRAHPRSPRCQTTRSARGLLGPVRWLLLPCSPPAAPG